MSWSRIVLPLLLTLAACGFQPLYGERGVDRTVASEQLAEIRVEAIRDRSGQQLYNRLVDRLTPRGQPGDPRYLLKVVVDSTTEPLVFREDETATRANVILEASFTLRQATDGAVVFKGVSRSTSSYDILRNPFATVVSEEDAVDRATLELSEDIRTRLAVFLSNPVAKAP